MDLLYLLFLLVDLRKLDQLIDMDLLYLLLVLGPTQAGSVDRHGSPLSPFSPCGPTQAGSDDRHGSPLSSLWTYASWIS